MSTWSRVKLGEVLRRSDELVNLDPETEYKEVTVRLWGRGVVERGRVLGAASGSARRFVARTDQLILSRIDARNGALGLVPRSLDGAIVSNDFPLFELDRERLLPEFLGWLVQTRGFVELCQRASEGTTNRVRLQEQSFLAIEIPLPELSEQRRVRARIEELAVLVKEARARVGDLEREADSLRISLAHRLDLDEQEKLREGWKLVTLRDVLEQVQDRHPVRPGKVYPNCGMLSFGKGLFHKPPIDGGTSSAQHLYKITSGAFIYSRLFAFEGAYGYVTDEFGGCFVSNEYPTFRCDPARVRAEFLVAYLKPQRAWTEIAASSKGLGDRRLRVQPAQLLDHRLWLPPLALQHQLAEVGRHLDRVNDMHSKSAAELEALLPAVLDQAFRGELT